MKKTIIALTALAGAAMGADFSTLTSYSITLGDTTTKSLTSGSKKMWLDGKDEGLNLDNGWFP